MKKNSDKSTTIKIDKINNNKTNSNKAMGKINR